MQLARPRCAPLACERRVDTSETGAGGHCIESTEHLSHTKLAIVSGGAGAADAPNTRGKCIAQAGQCLLAVEEIRRVERRFFFGIFDGFGHRNVGLADALLAASVFHFGEIKISEVKKMMSQNGIQVRL